MNEDELQQKWSQAGSNRQPPACKAGALPVELWPQKIGINLGLGGLEPPASPLSGVRSNQLSYRPVERVYSTVLLDIVNSIYGYESIYLTFIKINGSF